MRSLQLGPFGVPSGLLHDYAGGPRDGQNSSDPALGALPDHPRHDEVLATPLTYDALRKFNISSICLVIVTDETTDSLGCFEDTKSSSELR